MPCFSYFVHYHFAYRRKEKIGTITPSKQHSSVHFFPKIMDSDSTTLIPLSRSFSQEMPIGFYQITSTQNSSTLSSRGQLASKSTILSCSHKDSSLGKQSAYQASETIPRPQGCLFLSISITHRVGWPGL